MRKQFVAALVFSLVLTGAALSSGCTAGIDSADDSTQEDEEAEVSSTQEAIVSGWTPFTSEEFPPIVCDGGSLINTVQCTGKYCDNLRTYCKPTGGSKGGSYWTSYFSEEGTSYRTCSPGYWMTGLSCTGKYCDNVSLQCAQISGANAVNCYWTGWMSEENGGTLGFGAGYYARGAQCGGSYCDNLRYLVCQKL
jgi:hypothetical protein